MSHSNKLSVAFLWHMHQPCYKDTLTGAYFLPWTRLHAVKDYYPMAALFERFDKTKATFNLVPSLIEQLDDYGERGASDTFLDLTVKKASDLTEDEGLDILGNFFSVNFNRFIEPNSRYVDLLLKRGAQKPTEKSLKRALKDFSRQDMLDLQVLFNLAWFHSINIDEDPMLKGIVGKGGGYSEEDKDYVVAKQRDIIRRIIPLYKRLQDAGKIEISTTPFYHPITPLICDTSIARMSMPRAPLPEHRFTHPEDARWHIAEAIKCHKDHFGRAPKGMWPSEGSVSSEALSIMASEGIKWAATDEDILFNTIKMIAGKDKTPACPDRNIIYETYRFQKGEDSLSLVFRDKNISDIISFNYNAWDQAEAARDLIYHFNNIADALRPGVGKGIVTIAMDGENAWEYFEDNGRTFFDTLYGLLEKEERLETVTIAGHLAVVKPGKTFDTIFPASWINHEFRIWIGEEQDNMSWDYLWMVRRDLVKFTRELERQGRGRSEKLQKAWRAFYIAEGSDWNWWYGGRARAGGDNPFDRIYRTHLQDIYRFLEKPIPDFLKISIA
ncbi:MAG: glycoside hydrolase family 57 protein [Candidatus Omnitrophica bacterium]|nr:glycoside hydrolase family 57 protein [Candidatus Omnitrophota bacterium]